MDEKERQEFDLEDILKEFSDEALPEESVELSQEELSALTAELEIGEEALSELMTEPAIPSEEVPEEASTAEEAPAAEVQAPAEMEQTIRLEFIPDAKGHVNNAQPIEDEEETQPAAPSAPEKEEAFSQNWEPEYEQPIAEYVPPQPIVFHPRSRLRELKRKLVAGPEKRYYELSEKGLGKLQLAIFLSFLVVVASAVATAMHAMGMVPENRQRLMVFSQFLAMLVSALLGSFQLIEGVADLFKKRFTLNTLMVFTFVVCCVDGVFCLQEQRIPCCAAFSLQVMMSLWSAYNTRTTQLGQLDTMRKASRLDGIRSIECYYQEAAGLVRGEGEVEDFMDTYQKPSTPEKIMSIYAIAVLLISIGAGVTGGILHDMHFGVQVTAVTLLAAVPATAFITLSRPMAVLERRLHAMGTVLCGWQGVKGLCRKAVFPVKHDDLFPSGCIKMNGVKFFGDRSPDEIVAYAAALIGADGGGLVPLFNQLLESRNGIHYDAVNLRAYDGGIGAEVNGEPVLAGSLDFLRTMGVEVQEGIRVSNAVCVAVDGEMCGLFALNYEKLRSASAGLATLCAYRKLKPMLVTNDVMITEGFIRSRFGINPKKMEFPDHETRLVLQDRQPQEGARSLALVTREGLAPFAYAVTGARSLRTASILGLVIHMLGGVLGMAMMVILAVLGAAELLTPGNLFLYMLVWMIPGMLITGWTRTI